ncbi:TonB-dependent receptor domain-containing protein [Paraflavitalea speifideaquila]|uniref:TonB-dependent receptor domain-containing protein n=1 Tax=Paraflavitalea speifideaquila TaxID=3076558 RepID=UPI0028E7EE79|nr:TonB-dependent receptor [Paraflavitalea speifideiaquila]
MEFVWRPGGCLAFWRRDFFRNHADWVTGGKLRASYGTSGNDPALYQTIGVWQPSAGGSGGGQPGNGQAGLGLRPELNKKFETAIELEIARRWSIGVARYTNLTSRQVITINDPGTVDKQRLINANAEVENAGYEISLSYHTPANNRQSFFTELVFSTYKNKLRKFEGLASSCTRIS